MTAGTDPKTLIRRLIDDVWNTGDTAAADWLVDPNIVDHSAPPGLAPGLAGLRQVVAAFRGAFPDLRITIEDIFAEGDRVAARVTARGTHRGEFMGIPATGRSIELRGIRIDRISGGKIAEHWASFDQLGLMQQLGVIPSGAAPGR